MPRALWKPWGGGLFLMSAVPLYTDVGADPVGKGLDGLAGQSRRARIYTGYGRVSTGYGHTGYGISTGYGYTGGCLEGLLGCRPHRRAVRQRSLWRGADSVRSARAAPWYVPS